MSMLSPPFTPKFKKGKLYRIKFGQTKLEGCFLCLDEALVALRRNSIPVIWSIEFLAPNGQKVNYYYSKIDGMTMVPSFTSSDEMYSFIGNQIRMDIDKEIIDDLLSCGSAYEKI